MQFNAVNYERCHGQKIAPKKQINTTLNGKEAFKDLNYTRSVEYLHQCIAKYFFCFVVVFFFSLKLDLSKQEKVSVRGKYSRNFGVGLCRRVTLQPSPTLDLFPYCKLGAKNPYPVPD